MGIRRLPLEFTTNPESLVRLLDLEHPNLLPVREVLRDQTGIYLVTDWADHGTLQDRLAAGYPDSVVLHMVSRGVSRALSYLHRRCIAPTRLETGQILETRTGLFQVAGYGVPEQPGEETSLNPCQEDSDSGADRFQVDLIAFATLIESLRDELPSSLRAICERCRPEARDALKSAGELLLEIERLPDVLALSEFDHERERRQDAGPQPVDPPPSDADRDEATAEQFPWRPMEDLYRLEGSPMKGGMGSVWMATELATGRKVAIKRLHKDTSGGSNVLERFCREARSIAHLSHPHILHLLQPARDTQGDYLVLEWAAGGSLRERLSADGPLPPEEVLEIARKIGGALSYAHSKGVIHRDIKPHNILLTETGEPKLADFGLARSVDDATLSSSRAGAGSPLYMPPEQYDSASNTDARSDIYSLGKTLYQLLTNKSPASPLPELLPKRFRAPLARCMEPDPEDRPASIEDFLSELEQDRRRPLLLPLLLAVVVLMSAAWIYSRTSSEAPGDADKQGEQGAGVNGPALSGPGVGPDLIVTAQVLLAGLFTKNGGQALAQGEQTDQDRVEIRLEFDPAPTDVQPEIVVRRGAQRLSPEDLQITWVETGVVVISVPLVGRKNQFEVEVPERNFQSGVIDVVRMDPQPVLTAVSDAGRIEAADELYLTRRKTVEIQLDVLRAEGIGTLWLARNETREEVPIEQSRIEKTVELSEGENDFRWFWPDESSPLSSGRFRIRADFTPPEIALTRPAPDLLTNQSTLTLKGQVQDANVGLEIGWKLRQDGQLVTEGSAATEANGSFSDELLIPFGRDGELTLEISALDRAGNPAAPLWIHMQVDRKPPELKAAPSFTPGWDQAHKLTDVALSGTADEPLLAATVNEQPMEIFSETRFRISGLKLLEGEAYAVVLTDLAGNHSVASRFAHAVDVTPPAAKLRFVEQEKDGLLLLSITPAEPLSSLEVDGKIVEGTFSVPGAILAPVSGSLFERITWRPVDGQPVSGPTNAPIELSMTDSSGNRASHWLVVCPEDGVTAVRCTVDPNGQIAGTEPCAECGGRYCPRTGTRGEHDFAGEWPIDCWLRPSEKQCGYCGWNNP